MFEPLPAEFSFSEAEHSVREFWERHDIFGRSLEQRREAPRFVFYEGPPTANGLPHPGHCLTRTIKDLFPRYQTMCGKLVERKAGWDTHGLPVEVEVCKELGIHTKEEIEAYGVEKFVRRCIDSVFKYVKEWEQLTRRLGFWVNLDEAYVTFHQSYVESVWWGLKQLFERGLLYQGHKVVWWWAQGGTALSAGEVGEGYRTVQDPSIYVRFPLVAEAVSGPASTVSRPHEGLPAGAKVSLLVWTTTPWTLVSNHFAAVGPDFDYALIHDKTIGEYLYIASSLVQDIADKTKHDFEVVGVCKGADLVGLRYKPPFDCFARKHVVSTGKVIIIPELPPLSSEEAQRRVKWSEARCDLVGEGNDSVAWRVIDADFVELGTGTGIVHIAPAFGEVDFNRLQQERERFADPDAVPLINAVKPDGTFSEDAPVAYRGRWVKDCDKDIIRELKERAASPEAVVLYHQETIEHEYPFCPRAEEDALIQYARKSWFVRTSQFKDEFLKNNNGIRWLPDHIQEGRFGDFLRNNVDWALSRERYWGTPLPVWVCERCGKMEAIGSLAELQGKPGATDRTNDYPGGMWAAKKQEDPSLPEHLQVHKPYIDAWTYDALCCKDQTCVVRMRRVPEVIDCWWDAGSMPFAQWGFPHKVGSVQTFSERFPADFISEALDQTRGWFYGLLAISTLLFKDGVPQANAYNPGYPHPYKACIVLGLMMGEDGLKMSKRKKNYREPTFIFDNYGADALRWYLFSGQTPWTSVRFQEASIRDAHREFLVRLYNVFSFFNIYANIDGFTVEQTPTGPQGTGWRPVAERGELDRWIVSELHQTTQAVRTALDKLENYPAAGRLNQFVDALSNWYVRRSRDRYWRAVSADTSSFEYHDKWDAYNTLYEVLVTLSKLIAPFTPFFAETMYQNLVRSPQGNGKAPAGEDAVPLSVHLCDYPEVDAALLNEELAQEMDLVRQIVSLGRAARTAAKLKVRQPLGLAEIILVRREHTAWLEAHSELIAEELNIKGVEFTTEADHYVTHQVKPNFKSIGPKFGGKAKQVAGALNKVDASEARKALEQTGSLTLDLGGESVQLTQEDVEIRLEAKPGWSAAQGRDGVVVVKTELTPALIDEGLVREVIHLVQGVRKDLKLPYEARIEVHAETTPELQAVIERHADTIKSECLATTVVFGPGGGGEVREAKVEGHKMTLSVMAQQ